MGEKDLRFFIVADKYDICLTLIRPIRRKDELLTGSLDQVLKFVSNKEVETYSTGFFFYHWLELLSRDVFNTDHEYGFATEELAKHRQNLSQPWFMVFSDGSKSKDPPPPFQIRPYFFADELQSYYAKIKDGRISNLVEFYRKIGYVP
ncbi:hypothetical protein AYK26_03375 [Euryarchaeota archaeon SM23-78]|nr:MAG: hypothetical protein AYK26_03375 [Euryarchaeota archaeon SM23-78]MBW3000801.1 hypothetical protein [Candidatus Woesearchaeota archaeon]